MVSFATEIKNEIASKPLDHWGVYELMAMTKINGSAVLSRSGLNLEIRTENAKIASRIHRLTKNQTQSEIEFLVSRKVRFSKNNTYIVKVISNVDELIKSLYLFDIEMKEPVFDDIDDSYEKTKAYLRGCFLASGSVNSPLTSQYHLEMAFDNQTCADYVVKLMTKYELNAKIIERRKNFVVYLKASDKIADFLKVIGADQGVLYYERERAERDFLNNINRLDNCEIANDVKMIEAGLRQVEAIHRIKAQLGLDVLDEKTREIADLRLLYPESSLNELCELYLEKHKQVISKSGMYHRMKKITNLSKTLID